VPFRKNVFVLGAGASADAGAPLLRDFLDKARELMGNPHSPLSPGDRERFKHVFDYQWKLRVAESRVLVDLDNIEDLFSLMDLEDLAGIPEAHSVRTDLLRLIVMTLEHSIRPVEIPNRDSTPMKNPYLSFVRYIARVKDGHQVRKENGDDAIISMNYDLLIDHAFRDARIRPDYQLKGVPPFTNTFDGTMRLLKLHGSANWFYCPDCKRVRVGTSPNDPPVCEGNIHPLENLIVPPTWNKGAHQGVLADIWAAARDELTKADRIFLVGYSAPATDRYFTYLLTSAMRQREAPPEIFIVNRDPPPSLKQMFVGWFGNRRVQVRQQPFAWYIRDMISQDLGHGGEVVPSFLLL
jgi:hypothetical protein